MLRRQHGQGLVETLIVLLFISVSIVAFMGLQHYLSLSTNQTQQQIDATVLATKQIENLRDFVVVNTQSPYEAYDDIASSSTTATVGNTTYTIATTVTTNASPAYKTLSVSVSWTDRFNTSQSVRLVTLVSNVDPGGPGAYM